MKPILAVSFNPARQKTLTFDEWLPHCVNRATKMEECAGGKGANFSRALALLGTPCLHATFTTPQDAALYAEWTKADGAQLANVGELDRLRTCTTLVHSRRHEVTELIEPSGSLKTPWKRVFSNLKKYISNSTAGVINGSLCGNLGPSHPAEVVRFFRTMNKECWLDLTGQVLLESLEAQPSGVKINLEEFLKTFFPRTLGNLTDQELLDLVTETSRRYKVPFLVTRGALPLVWAVESQSGFTGSSLEEGGGVVNTTGCGDAVLAGLLHGLQYLKSETVFLTSFLYQIGSLAAQTSKPAFFDGKIAKSLYNRKGGIR